MKFLKGIKILPVAIIAFLFLYSFYEVYFNNYLVDDSFYRGFAGWVISFVLFFLNQKYYRWFLFFLLIIGLFGFVDFYFVRIEINSINVITSVVLFVFILVEFESVKERIKETFYPSKEEILKKRESKYNYFKHKFEKLSKEELQEKSNMNLVQEAQKAIQDILDSRIRKE